MNKDGLFQELDSLIEDGKKELSKYSYIDDPYEFQYVDKFFFEPWYYKVLTILSLFPELANNPFSNSISHLNDAFYSDVEMIIKDLEAIKELVEKDIINLENDNSPTDYHENKANGCDYRHPAFPGGQHADKGEKLDTNHSAERVGKHIIPLKQSSHQKQLERLDGEGEQDCSPRYHGYSGLVVGGRQDRAHQKAKRNKHSYIGHDFVSQICIPCKPPLIGPEQFKLGDMISRRPFQHSEPQDSKNVNEQEDQTNRLPVAVVFDMGHLP